jgi:hypothetical protein
MTGPHIAVGLPGLLLAASSAWAQAPTAGLYVPREFENAYAKKTRAADGRPGPAYWQNRADYRIQATLEPRTGVLRGQETIRYQNNSPDTLRSLLVRLYQDMYKAGSPRDLLVDAADVHGGVEISRLTVNGQATALRPPNVAVQQRTNRSLRLPQPLMPGAALTLDLAWQVRLPRRTRIRMGALDSTSYFVGYWYPQVAVYDDLEGWDTFNYTGQQEFYNDCNSFEVDVTMPRNFLVWATGDWLNPAEILTAPYLAAYQQARTADAVVHLVDSVRSWGRQVTGPQATHTWKFRAENVPDFAFATSNHYLWDATSVVADSATGRRVLVAAAYPKAARDFHETALAARHAVAYFSRELPGIPYPYPQLTVFNGLKEGGMEFPMMANNASKQNREEMLGVTAHEIAHTYFPFYLGINERKYAWMEEGWASFLDGYAATYVQGQLDTGSPAANPAAGVRSLAEKAQWYAQDAGTQYDVPLMTPSVMLRERWMVGTSSYVRPALAYSVLLEVLGKSRFREALREYARRWHGKHPTPYDFFYTFDAVAGESLSWFWQPWFFESGAPAWPCKLCAPRASKL